MALQTFFSPEATTNLPKQTNPTQTSSGASSAGLIVALNSAGDIDATMLPPGSTLPTMSVPASENLSAGAMVNLYNNSGTLTARNANATDATKPAVGFVLAAVTSPANAQVYFIGAENNAVSGLTIGSPVFLSASTPGGVTATAPSAAGNLVQQISFAALTASEFVFCPNTVWIHG